MSKLLDFMRELGRDATLATDYDSDKDATMRKAGLSDGERKAMLDKDYDAIKRLTGLVDGQFATNHIIIAYEES